jgi:hypothetical protein
MRNIILASAMLAATSVSFADDLIMTTVNGKSGGSVSFDLLSNGAAAGVQINIPVEDAKVDLSGLNKTPAGNFSLQSSYNGKEIVILVSNDDNRVMSKGQINLGTIRVSNGSIGTAKLIVADAKAESIQSSIRSN